MSQPELNNPLIRQDILRARIKDGGRLVATALAREFDVSVDTIRRDLLALEEAGAVERVRGGAIPVRKPVAAVSQRIQHDDPVADQLADTALPLIKPGMVLIMDGGTTTMRLSRKLPDLPGLMVVTPAPMIALTTMDRGIETILIGGKLGSVGGIATGMQAEQAIANIAADLCFLGVCGIDPAFGLSSDDYDENNLKQKMHAASGQLILLTHAEKLDTRARHKTLPCEQIDTIITNAHPDNTGVYASLGVNIEHIGH